MRTWLLLGAALLLGGCSAYQAGGPKPAFRNLEIAPVRNSTSRTGTHAVLHAKLADAFAGDPRVRLGSGDAILATEVTEYRRDGFTTKPGDAFAFNSFRVTFGPRHAHDPRRRAHPLQGPRLPRHDDAAERRRSRGGRAQRGSDAVRRHRLADPSGGHHGLVT